MNELVELYESTSFFHNDLNEYIEESCEIIKSLEATIILENKLADNNLEELQSEELNNAVAEKIDKVKRIETIVPVIGKAKVHIVNVWSFKKYIDNELDKLLKTGKIEDVGGKNSFTATIKSMQFDSLQKKMYEMTKELRIPSKITVDKNGNVSETITKRDNTRQGYVDALSFFSIGIILHFVTAPVLNNIKATRGVFLKAGIEKGLLASHPLDTIKRKMSGTWGEPYETVTIDELYKRIKELDPEHFATIADNEIEAIRKEFTRSKKMKRLGKINGESPTSAVKLAGDIVNTQADYINFRQTIANYYIKIIDRSFAILRKGVNKNNKKE